MSVVHGMRGAGGVCEICMRLGCGGVGEEWGECMRGLGVGFINPVGTGGVLDGCLCLDCGGVGSVAGEGLGPGSGGVALCLYELLVWILCIDGRSRYLYIVLGRYLRIIGAHSVQSCCTCFQPCICQW